MREWEKEGATPEAVLNDFVTGGTQGIKELQALTAYMEKLNIEGIKEMYKMNEEATLEILLNVYGNKKAFEIYLDVMDNYNIDFKYEFENTAEALNALQKHSTELEQENKKIKEDLEIAIAQAEVYRKSLWRQDRKFAELKQEDIELSKKELAAAQREYRELEEENKFLQNLENELREELRKYKEYHKNHEELVRRRERNTAKIEITRLKKEILELKAEIYDMRKEKAHNEANKLFVTPYIRGYGIHNIQTLSGGYMGNHWQAPYGNSFCW